MDAIHSDRRVPALDVLRGVAIAMVLLAHMPIPLSWHGQGSGFTIGKLLGLGAYGVDLFFVLSGLLISTLLFEEFDRHGAIDLKRFWIRRSFKIWPAYFVVYGAAFAAKLLYLYMTGRGQQAMELASCSWPNFLFIQNYVNPECFWHFSWSIAVEEHFYLILPIVMICCFSSSPRYLLWACAAAFIAVMLARLTQSNESYYSGAVWRQTHLRADGLVVGVLLGFVSRYARRPAFFERRHVPWALAALMGVIFAIGISIPIRELQWFGAWMTLVPIGTGAIVYYAATVKRAWMPHAGLATSLVWLGRYSYTVYLCQIFFFEASKKINFSLSKTALSEIPIAASLFVAGSVAAGWLAHKQIEQPFLRIRNRVFPSLSVASNRKDSDERPRAVLMASAERTTDV